MLKKFKTVKKIGSAEIIEKKSRFIANVFPIENEETAKAILEDTRKKYWDARHNCFAYQIGERNEIQKFSDDGEPGGTAGKPILDVLVGEEIKNTIIIVTRYFGGVLLGTGGLVRAYGKSAKKGLINAGIVEKALYKQLKIKTDYSLLGKIQYEIAQKNVISKDIIYTENVEITALAEYDESVSFIKRITDVTGGSAEIEELGEEFIMIDL